MAPVRDQSIRLSYKSYYSFLRAHTHTHTQKTFTIKHRTVEDVAQFGKMLA